MLLIIPKNYENAPEARPDLRAVAAMMQFNKALAQAGVLRVVEGLAPPAKGARVSFTSNGEPVVQPGPFPDAKGVSGGYWIIDVPTREEAIEWAKRCPMMHGETIEIRPILELSDFSDDVQRAAAGFEQLRDTLYIWPRR